MNIHCLQHVPFEGPGFIEHWAGVNSHNLSRTRVYRDEEYPDIEDIDLLVIMGGPMNIYQYSAYAWLKKEKEFIKQVITSGQTRVLGICLGAQLIADCLNAKVTANPQKEIGWFEIKEVKKYFDKLPEKFKAFHWHGDIFAVPSGAELLFSSEACRNQGFIYQERVLALQFHLESTPESISQLIENCRDELETAGRYIQDEDQIIDDINTCQQTNQLMSAVLEQFLQ